MTINCITSYYENIVTVATEAHILNFALISYLVHRSLKPTVGRSQLVAMNTLFPWGHRHTILGYLSEGMQTSYMVHNFLETTAIDGEHSLLMVTLLPWQQWNNFITLAFESQ